MEKSGGQFFVGFLFLEKICFRSFLNDFVVVLFEVVRKAMKKYFGFDILLSAGQKSSEAIVLLEHAKSPFYLYRAVYSKCDSLFACDVIQRLPAVFVEKF